MSDLISKSVLYKKIAKLEDLARDRVLDTPTNSPCYMRYVAQVNERTNFKHIIADEPTIEAEPVRYGEWVDNGERDKHGVPKPFAISCSICGSSAGTYWMKYCPHCGAKMRGDQL